LGLREGSNKKLENLHDGELHNSSFLSNIIRAIKSRMRWIGHIACLGERKMHAGFCSGNLNECHMCRWEDNTNPMGLK
jgi:hypothetical protein